MLISDIAHVFRHEWQPLRHRSCVYCFMLRIAQQGNAAAAKKYYSAADYYTEGQEIVGLWGGVGAKRLGLSGVIDKDSFELLCDNRDPRTKGPLTVRTKEERTVGYDFTWSVPKSVSLLY